MNDIDKILEDRKHVHGAFQDNADRTVKLIRALGPEYATLPNSAQFGIMMILGKIARIVSGDPTFADHWDDIQGYAKKSLEALQESKPKKKKVRTCKGCYDTLNDSEKEYCKICEPF